MSAEQMIENAAQMRAFALQIATQLRGGDVLLLTGELGAGKTTFTQGVAAALGVQESVTSPTFTIVSDYPVSTHPTITTLVHVDLYRLEPNQAAHDPAIREVLATAGDRTKVTIIEWADRLTDVSIPAALHVAFSHGPDSHTRLVRVS